MKLVSGKDFYVENGKYVFTAEYLLKRGSCCENGCRHCPYNEADHLEGQAMDIKVGDRVAINSMKVDGKPMIKDVVAINGNLVTVNAFYGTVEVSVEHVEKVSKTTPLRG